MKDIIVKKSKIHGLGIFAARDFKKGEIVIKWSSHKEINREDIKKLSEEEKQHISYINGKYILVPLEAWVNHSCDPNVYLDKKHFSYVAKRNIKKGEEITTDYREESEPGFKMRCSCRSKNCKGFIEVPK